MPPDQLTVTLDADGDLGILTIDHPPVNALSPTVVRDLGASLDEFDRRGALRALVLRCTGRTFCAGGDIAAFDEPGFSPAPLNALLERLEAGHRPVVAALHGTVLGGGLELALACHARVAARGTRLGLPEVRLGLLPGSLGTQRLPRLVGVPRALQMITRGEPLEAGEALAAGLVDTISDGDPVPAALDRARALAEAGGPLRRTRLLPLALGDEARQALAQAYEQARDRPQEPALEAIARCVEAAATMPWERGAELERESFEHCLRSAPSRALRHLFFAERRVGRRAGGPESAAARAVRHVGVLGAGTMGRGIAMCFADAGLDVTLVDTAPAALERARAAIGQVYEAAVARGRLTPGAALERQGRIRTARDDTALAGCDLVIEAVFEDLALKREVAARLGRVCRPGAILATNTSTLDVDRIAEATGRPADVVGMHFFSPAHVMRLLEVVRGARTDAAVLRTVVQLAREVGKVPVVCGVCWGFIGNRMAEVYMRETEFLLLEGATPGQIDAAIESLGMAMGPCRMLDMAGVDVGARTVIERDRDGGLPADPAYRIVCRALFERGRHGQKTGSGYYRYEGRRALPDEATLALCAELAQRHGIARRQAIGTREIVERLMFSLVNEGARLLGEGIAARASDIDVVWTAGFGFPRHLGGPMHWADETGLEQVVQGLNRWAAARGNAHGYWSVSPLLRALAQGGGRLARWEPPGA